MKLRSLAATGLCSVLIFAANTAAAADDSWTPRTQGSRVGAEIGIWSREHIDAFAFAVVAQIELIKVLHLDFEVPWSVARYDNGILDPETLAVFGNPTFGAHYGANLNEKLALYVGGTISVPTSLDLNYESFAVGLTAAASNAYGDTHRYLPEFLHIRPRGGIEVRILPVLYYRGELAPLVMIPVGKDVNDAEFLLETSHEIEARAPVGVGGGIRLQGVFLSYDNDDNAQAALEPYFAFEPPQGHFYARLGLLVALDEELGFGFDRGKVATARISLGGKW
jgi:hypothetical protein